MYCTACGQQLVQGAVVCPRCGRPAGVAPFPVVYNRVHRHVQTLGILWLVFAGWTVVQGLIAVSILSGVSAWGMHGRTDMMMWPFWGGHVSWLVPVVAWLLGVRAILSVVTGIALMQRRPWARVLAIVAAILTILKPITGTALAIYTLWVLAPRLSGQEWEQVTLPGFPGSMQG
ncbi:MAG: zinc ribbon domain-containing protein [Acidobacteriaceae bacterium]